MRLHQVLWTATLLTLLTVSWPCLADDRLWVELSAEERAKPTAGNVDAGTFARLSERLSPAVVLIRRKLPRNQSLKTLLNGPDAADGFQDAGTGFVIRGDGYILTNQHNVQDAQSVTVRFEDETELPARLVGAYAPADLALLKVESDEPLVAAPLGDSSELKIAEWVLAIGSPLGLNNSVTAGIVSAKGRKELRPLDDLAQRNHPFYADFIQTDASINPGNSGGPLINMRGEVIGINTANYETAYGKGQGIGFAIPVNMAKKLLPQLAKGKVERAYLGIIAQDVTKQNAQALGLEKAEGALVAQVVKGSPAAEAGLKVGDIIMQFNGEPVRDSSDLRWFATTAGVGSKAALGVLRKRQDKVFTVTMAPLPIETLEPRAEGKVEHAEGVAVKALGMYVREMTEQERKKAGIGKRRGIRITATRSQGPAAAAGLRAGDIVLRFGYAAVLTPKAFVRMVDNAKSGAPIVLHIQRNGHELWVNLRKL